ncbi:MAG: ABC transporter ATP-binding protein [Acidimicrobiales bacterium]
MSAIEVDGLVKTYGDRNVVDGVSFTVEQGEIFGIVGPNGAGKTTVVESVEGLRRPDGGSITVLGLDPQRDRAELTQRLGVQLQESRLQDRIKVEEALELYASFYRTPADWRSLVESFGLGDRLGARYADLSGGQKQRLAVALALIGSPELAILDELTTGLDPRARRSTWDTVEAIRNSGVTVVLVTHFMDEAERLCDRIMVIDRGRVVALDTPAGLMNRVGSEQTMRFRPSGEIDQEAIRRLPEVTSVEQHGAELVVSGAETVVQTVSTHLAALGIRVLELRVEQVELEDAYLHLTSGDRAPSDGEDGA